MFTIRGRVIAVAPRGDGTYGVTLGPSPELFWYIAPNPAPKLGTELTLLAERVLSEKRITVGNQRAALMTLDGVSPHPESSPRTPIGRVVPQVWFERVRAVMERPLRAYQEEGAAWLAWRLAAGRGSILADEQGLGKSCQTVAALAATGLLPTVVIVPKGLLRNWERELAFAKFKPRVAIVRRTAGTMPTADVIITTYQVMRSREQELMKLGARALVFDEAQLIKEPRPHTKAHRAAVATRIGRWVQRVVFLTGTPVLNRPEELWRLLHVCDPDAWPDFPSYRDRYCKAPTPEDEAVSPAGERRILTSTGRVEHVDELRALVEPYIMRRLKVDVATDLPPKSRNAILIELDDDDLKDYRRAEKNLAKWLREQGRELEASRLKRAEALVRLTHLRRMVGEAKLRTALPEYLRQWYERPSPPPLLVFAYFRAVCNGLEQIAISLGLRVSTIRGADSDTKRQAAIDAFMEGRTDIFIAPIKAAGVGINLQRAADVLFVERHWVTKELEQAEDRAHRIGSTKPVTVTYLDAADTIDEEIARVNAAKSVLVDALIDDKRTDGAEFAAADEIIRSYMRKSSGVVETAAAGGT